MIRFFRFSFVCAALLLINAYFSQTQVVFAQNSSVEQATEPLFILSGERRFSFSVEVMRTDEQRAKGLMFRRFMPPDRGMLFDFKRVDSVSMWMQNTYISLDMIFIRADGTIARITEHTEPLSTRVLPSREPVLSVLELNAGTAERLGFKVGDKIVHSIFK